MASSNNLQTLEGCSQLGDIAGVARLLALRAYSRTHTTKALCEASRNGHAECVKILIPLSDPKANGSEPLCEAATNGHVECVKILIPVSEPKANNSEALRLAAGKCHVDTFKLLLSVSDPLIEMKGILSKAIGYGETDILAIMFCHEPRFLERLDLPRVLGVAIAKKQSELALFIGSLIEQKMLAANLPPPASLRSSATAPRL